MQKDLEQKDSKIMILTEKYDALEKLFDDNQINSLKDDIKDKDAQINGL